MALTQFLATLALFLALHSIPAIDPVRQRLIARLGRRPYLMLYSIVSLLAFFWLFQAAFQLDYVALWPAAAWQAWIALALVPIALFLLITGLISPNPASITFRRGAGNPGAIVAITRHPVLWGFILWALSHVIANGDLKSLLLFGTLGLFAGFGIITTERRTRRRLGDAFQDIARTTAILPLAAIAQGRARLRLDTSMVIGLVLAAMLTLWLLSGGHAALFSADPLAMASI